MPAIQLARLKIQVDEQISLFNDPAAFVRELHTLLEFYADRTRRPGKSGKPRPLIQAYNVPRQVMRQIEVQIAPQVASDYEAALVLADQLWQEDWYESRLLAISILGMLPTSLTDEVVIRLQAWGKVCKEDALLDALLEDGTQHLRAEAPQAFEQLVEGWVTATDLPSRKVGLRALPALIQNPEFENLPLIFRWLAPLAREVSSSLETDLLKAVRTLARRSPKETAYFLEQNITTSHRTGAAWLARRSLDVFPPDLQAGLREVLRTEMRATGTSSET